MIMRSRAQLDDLISQTRSEAPFSEFEEPPEEFRVHRVTDKSDIAHQMVTVDEVDDMEDDDLL
jgi:hypothetical protein